MMNGGRGLTVSWLRSAQRKRLQTPKLDTLLGCCFSLLSQQECVTVKSISWSGRTLEKPISRYARRRIQRIVMFRSRQLSVEFLSAAPAKRNQDLCSREAVKPAQSFTGFSRLAAGMRAYLTATIRTESSFTIAATR